MKSTICNSLVVVGGLALLAACAGSSNRDTALDQVKQSRYALDDTNSKLSRADAELNGFQGQLAALRTRFEKAGDPTSRERASSSLGRLSVQVEQARLDLQKLQSENRERVTELDSRLNNLAKSARQMLQKGDGGERAAQDPQE